MVDDLILQGVTEPYRMLTARAEYRLRLRADNASTRLTPLALQAGCVGEERALWFNQRLWEKQALEAEFAQSFSADQLLRHGLDVKRDAGRMPLYDWLRFPTVTVRDLLTVSRETDWEGDEALLDELEQDGRYAPYIERQENEIREIAANEKIVLPAWIDYRSIAGLSNEMVERLDAARPENLAAAARVRGVTPAALVAIMVHAKRAQQPGDVAA
jgi:tRNA uridine 5-carboxymethylaminomethyl modification enzyme